jgi:hypothetical protein
MVESRLEGEKQKKIEEKYVPVPFRASGISHEITGDRIRQCAVKSRRLIASVSARRIGGSKRKEFLYFTVHGTSHNQEKRHQ